MSPVGRGEFSLTKFYRLRELVSDLASVTPGMTYAQVHGALSSGHGELADDLVLYSSGRAIDDPLLAACRTRSPHALILIWIALVMADHRLADIVEGHLTDPTGKLVPQRFNTDDLERTLAGYLPGIAARKPSTNILSYYRDSGLVVPGTYRGTIVDITRANDASESVPAVVEYVAFRLRHLRLANVTGTDDVALALSVKANAWINLTPDQFRAAARRARDSEGAPTPEPAPRGTEEGTLEELPIETQHTERFAVRGRPPKEARRLEHALVLAYKAWMQARGSEITSLRYTSKVPPETLIFDAYDSRRNNLLEAKADQSRPAVRMAIGQLIDYRRFVKPHRPSCAILLPERPTAAIEALLREAGISCVWRDADTFRDNADDRFV